MGGKAVLTMYIKKDTIVTIISYNYNMDILNIKKSKLRRELLRLYFNHPEKRYYIRELERTINQPAAYIRRELMNLEKEGLFISEFQGKQKYFFLDVDFYLYNEIKSIVNKTIGIEGELKEILKKIKGLEEAYIFGSYAKDQLSPESDIDLLVVGSASAEAVNEKIYKIQNKIGREINVINIGEKEFADRLTKKDPFLNEIMKNKKIKLL